MFVETPNLTDKKQAARRQIGNTNQQSMLPRDATWDSTRLSRYMYAKVTSFIAKTVSDAIR